jgi:hypothetical protein
MKKRNQKRQPSGAGAVVPASSRFDPLKCLALYDGQIFLGHLLHGSHGVKAFVDGASIGIFPNQKAAASAISAKAKVAP